MNVLLLEDICLKEISKKLNLCRKICRKNSYKLSSKYGDKILRYYSMINQYFEENDLEFFKEELVCLTKFVINPDKFLSINNFEFLNGHKFEYFKIIGSYKSNTPKFQFTTKHLHIQFTMSARESDDDFFFNCIVNDSIEIQSYGNMNSNIFSIFSKLIADSDKNLSEISMSIRLSNEFLKDILEIIGKRDKISSIKIYKLQKCSMKDNGENCQTSILLKNLSNSIKKFEFDENFCFYHANEIFRKFTLITNLKLSFNEEAVHSQINFLRNLGKNSGKTLKDIYFSHNTSYEFNDALYNFIKNCLYLENVFCKTTFYGPIEDSSLENNVSNEDCDDECGKCYPQENKYQSLKNSKNTIKNFAIDDYYSFDEYCENFLMNCHSLQEITIEEIIIDKNLIEIFKNSLNSVNKINFDGINEISSNNISNLMEFIKNLKNFNGFSLHDNQEFFNTIIKEFIVVKDHLEYLDITDIEINDDNFMDFHNLLNLSTNLKEMTLIADFNIKLSFIKMLISNRNFTNSITLLSIRDNPWKNNTKSLMKNLIESSHNLRELHTFGDDSIHYTYKL